MPPQRDLALFALPSGSCERGSERGNKLKQVYTDTSNNSSLTTYYYAGGSYEVQTDDDNNTVIRQYYSIGGVSVGLSIDGERSYYLTDHLGSISVVTDDTGAITSETRYTPFGEVRTDVGVIDETNYGYTGQERIPSLGLTDFNARMYDSSLGRFIQADSAIYELESSQGYNHYSYVRNSPISLIDPTGNYYCSTDDTACYAKRRSWHGPGGVSQAGINFIKIAESIAGRNKKNEPLYGDQGSGSFSEGSCTVGHGVAIRPGSSCQRLIYDGILRIDEGKGGTFTDKDTLQTWSLIAVYDYNQKKYVYKMSEDDSEDLFNLQLEKNAQLINSALTTKLTQYQWDAVQSFTYNAGYFQKLFDFLNSGDFAGAANFILTYGYDEETKSYTSKGAEARRKEEYELFLNGDYDYAGR